MSVHALVTRATFGRPKGQEAPPVRHCSDCGAKLCSSNRLSICAPCNGGTWDPEMTEKQARKMQRRVLEGLEVAA